MPTTTFPDAADAQGVRPSRSRAVLANELDGIPWLVGLDDEERRRVVADLRVVSVEPGELVCRIGRPVTYWFGVLDGLLKMSNDAAAMPITFTGLPPGGWFGEGTVLKMEPKMVLLDEPSMGLAPQIVEEVFEIVKDLNTKERVTFLLAEQNTNIALRYADYGYILENGRIVMDGEAKALRENEDVKEFYLGMGGGDRKSFRDVKSYKRRKRWLA